MSEYSLLAKNVIRKSLRIQPKESVIVECWNHGLDAAREILYQVRAAGARPMLLFEDEETHWRSVEGLPAAKLGQVARSEWAALAEADAYVFLPGPADIARYRKNMEKSQAATAYNADWYKRAEKAGLRGARLLLGYVTRERASSYGYDYDAWRSMVLEASSADFAAVSRKGKKIAALLSREAEVEITAPNGTHLTFELKGRPARAEDGIVDPEDVKAGHIMVNVPPGYAVVMPDANSAEGTVVFDRPAPYLGANVSGLRFDFEGGHATWSAEANAELIRSWYDRSKGAKDRLAYLGIGLNPAARYGFLQDDLVIGAVEIDIGDNSEEGGRNKSDFGFGSRLSQATVRVGKKTLVDGGRLAV